MPRAVIADPEPAAAPTQVVEAEATRSDLGTIARGGALNMVGAVVSGVLTFAFFVILSRGLGRSGYGAFISAMGIFTVLSRTAELGADTGLTRMIARYRALGHVADVRRTIVVALVPVLVVSAAFGAAMWVWAPELARIFGEGKGSGRIDDYARVLALFLPASAAIMVVLSGTRGFGTMIPTNLVDKLARSALQPLLALVVLGLGMGTTGVALAFAGPIGLGFVASCLWLRSLLRKSERRAGAKAGTARPTGELANRFWRFTAPRGMAGIFQVVILWINTLLLGGLDSTDAAGVFNAATRYITAGLMAGVALQQVMGPKISELLARRSNERAGAVYQTGTTWLVTLTWPLYFTFAIFSPTLLRVFGSGFEGGEAPLLVLSLTMLVATAVGTVDVVLLMGGRSSWNLIDTAVALVVGVVLNVLLIPPLGVTGAALAWAASILTRNLASLAQVWIFMRLHPFGPGFPKAAVASGLCYGALGVVLRVAFGTSIPVFLLYQLVAGVAYLALVWRFRHALELHVFWDELRRRRSKQPVPAEA
jgi:O-antigen/teichoic acid export membrane protein